MFQYISCCSLSIIPNTTDSGYYCFNTSHVVVYRAVSTAVQAENLFQYISCCSLSVTSKEVLSINCSFNTSHVVVYHILLVNARMKRYSFNTSHVVVYQSTEGAVIPQAVFQYISCCSLSIQEKVILQVL